MTKLLKCSCESEFQDSAYGKGNRVHNYAEKGSNWRCTVCGSSKVAPKEREKVITKTK